MTFVPLSRLLIDQRAGDHPVAFRNSERILFDHLNKDVAELAARLKNCHRAALVCSDSYYFIVGFLALLHTGALLVLPQNGQPEALNAVQDEFDVVVDDAFARNSGGQSAALTPLDAEWLALVFMTSGSTGAPKKIYKSVGMFEREVAALDTLWEGNAGNGDVYATVSHQHVYGLTFKLLWPLMTGRAFDAQMHMHWEDLLASLTPDATIISSPSHLDRLGGLEARPAGQKTQHIFSAGAPLSLAASQQAQKVFGCRPTEIFGSTETGAIATRCQIDGGEAWRALPGIEIRCDADGQLALRSPFAGPDWVETGDLIKQTPEGFHLRGRANRIAKIEGKRVSLAQTEQALLGLPFVAAVAAVLLPGERGRLVAAVVLSLQGRQALHEKGKFRFGRLLRSELASTCEPAAIPRQWRFLDVLPVRDMGKLRDADIRALFGEST